MAAQMIWKTCDNSALLPVTTNCTATLGTKATTAARSTSLGTAVNLSSISEGYYCVDSTGVMRLITTPAFPAKPTGCSTGGNVPRGLPAGTPGDYIQVTATYTYTPIFSAASTADTESSQS